jgi:hypothetical protein
VTCASISAPSNCTVPPVHRSEIDGHQVVWPGGRGLDRKTSGTAITLRDGYVIETLASEVPNFRMVVLGQHEAHTRQKGQQNSFQTRPGVPSARQLGGGTLSSKVDHKFSAPWLLWVPCHPFRIVSRSEVECAWSLTGPGPPEVAV